MKYRAILILFFVLTLPLLSSEPKTVKLTFSPETTYLMEPQLPDGRIDYIAALNKQLAAQTTPENNLIAGIFPLVPGEVKEFLTWADTTEEELPKAIQKYRERFGKMLGLGAVTPPLNAPIWFGPVSAFTEDSEKELLEFYTKEELAAMSEKCRELDKNHYKSRLDEGKITQEKYDTEIKRIETETTEKFYRCILGKQFQESLRHPWTAKEYPYIAKWLASTDEQGEKLMDIIRQRTGYYHPLLSHDEDSNLMYAVMFPYLQSLRSMARYFNCRGNFEFARGHFDQAMECAFASVRLGQTIRPGSSTIVEDLCGISMTGAGHFQLTIYLSDISKNKDVAWILQKKKEYDAIATEIPLPWPPIWCKGERFGTLSAVQMAAVEPKTFREFFKNYDEDFFVRYDKLFNTDVKYDWDEILKQVNFFHDDFEDMLLIPNWQRRLRAAMRLEQRVIEYSKRSVDSDDSPERKVVNFFLGELTASIVPMMNALARIEWDRQTTSVAFALAAYRADHNGESPETLEQLVPKYLEKIPDSPFTDKPLRYIRRQRDVLIANDDEYKLDGSEEELEKRIAEVKSGERVYPAAGHFIFVVAKKPAD